MFEETNYLLAVTSVTDYPAHQSVRFRNLIQLVSVNASQLKAEADPIVSTRQALM
jgi:hypothetical protein